jgi:hypothetical protein
VNADIAGPLAPPDSIVDIGLSITSPITSGHDAFAPVRLAHLRAPATVRDAATGVALWPPPPEWVSDCEIVPFASADECERLGKERSFVLIAVATT